MSYFIRYVITEEKNVTLPELEQGLQAVNPDYEIDGDLIVLDDEEFGQITIDRAGTQLFKSDMKLLREWAEAKSNSENLLAQLNQARILVTVQAIWSRSFDETHEILTPLFHWLFNHCKGLLVMEGGTFFSPPSEQDAGKAWFEWYVEKLVNHSTRIEGEAGQSFACPCCGYKTLSERGGYEICKVCFWEDDGQDDTDADTVRYGPNGSLSLTQARANFHEFGACERRVLQFVRPPRPEEQSQ